VLGWRTGGFVDEEDEKAQRMKFAQQLVALFVLHSRPSSMS
jgi:hypothetical protein